MERLNKVNLTYRKTVTYEKSGEVLTKFEPEVFKSWLEEGVDLEDVYSTEEDIENLEIYIDSVLDENEWFEWSEIDTTFKNTEIRFSESDSFGEGHEDQYIQSWIDKNKIESLTQQVESLTQKIKQGETK
jgi:hypothetical protein